MGATTIEAPLTSRYADRKGAVCARWATDAHHSRRERFRPRSASQLTPPKDAASRVSLHARVLKQPYFVSSSVPAGADELREEKMTTTRSRYSSLTTIVTALFGLGSLLI